MNHLRYMDQEFDLVEEELEAAQQQCVIGADLLTSRTRRRGAGKGNQLMRDVLTVLKVRGTEASGKGPPLRSATDASIHYPGIGGVGASSFSDWNQHSVIPPHPVASSWVLPGDKVDTPYGEGTVVKLFDTAVLNVDEPPLEGTASKPANGQSPSKMDVDAPAFTNAMNGNPSMVKKIKAYSSPGDMKSTLCPRICVKFPFGFGYFNASAVTSKESPSAYSDPQLCKRWKGLMETALSHAGQLDLEGMAAPFTHTGEPPNTSEIADNAAELTSKATSENPGNPGDTKLLPFGSSLLPTGTGRGSNLCGMTTTQLQNAFEHIFDLGGGVLGDVSANMLSC